MKSSYPDALAAVLKSEGGYVNDPRDKGGATMKGVTQRVYDAYRASMGQGSRAVRLITGTEIEAIYRRQYWVAIRGDELPAGVDYCIFDAAVNSGPLRAAKWLQAALGVPQDGHIGLVTLGSARQANAASLAGSVCDRRLAFLKGLKTWGAFGKGWARRVREVKAMALTMATRAG